MKRWTLLLAGAALWLFLAALPALADGGPHVASVNNGTGAGGLTADSCAGCHRAHTGQTDRLLNQPTETALCLVCHGAGSTGATTNVVNGVQFVPATNPLYRNASGVILGALRDGGFVTAAIGTSNEYKVITSPGRGNAKIPVNVSGGVMTGQAVTSAHMAVPLSPLTTFSGTTWGNLTNDPTTGTNAQLGATGGTLNCSSCHNPHGNNQYRILQTQPAVVGGDFLGVDTTHAVKVDDAALPPTDPSTGAFTGTRNYTVIQTVGGTGTLLASQVTSLASYSNLMGDYLRKQVPWDGSVTAAADAPNGNPTTFNVQMSNWCSACHTREQATSSADTTNANAIFHNRHQSTPNHGANGVGYVTCTTCHVAHGSNAKMTPGGYSATMPYPGGGAAPAGDSRLLKADNRGICQACHDPTGTLNTVGQILGGPLPTGIPTVP